MDDVVVVLVAAAAFGRDPKNLVDQLAKSPPFVGLRKNSQFSPVFVIILRHALGPGVQHAYVRVEWVIERYRN